MAARSNAGEGKKTPTVNQKSTLRQRRFRQFLFSEDELIARASHIEAVVRPIYEKWQKGLGSEAEIVASYILNFLSVMRPHDFRGGAHGEVLSASPDLLPPAVREFAVRSFRSTPLAVNRALVLWQQGECRLKLLDYVPDSLTVLRLQARGERVVTCFFRPSELTKLVGGQRDPLGFAMHDLVHADHFYGHKDWTAGQVEFYAEVLSRLERGDFAKLLQDHHLAERFNYVISDMNSHPAHLRQTLDSILLSNPY